MIWDETAKPHGARNPGCIVRHKPFAKPECSRKQPARPLNSPSFTGIEAFQLLHLPSRRPRDSETATDTRKQQVNMVVNINLCQHLNTLLTHTSP